MISSLHHHRTLIVLVILSTIASTNAWIAPASQQERFCQTAATTSLTRPLTSTSTRTTRTTAAATTKMFLKLPNEKDIDDFLDTSFFDPDAILKDDNISPTAWQKKFAQFVVGDYETAEAVLTGGFFVVLVIVSQELLRMQIHGATDYVPFTKVSGGGLF